MAGVGVVFTFSSSTQRTRKTGLFSLTFECFCAFNIGLCARFHHQGMTLEGYYAHIQSQYGLLPEMLASDRYPAQVFKQLSSSPGDSTASPAGGSTSKHPSMPSGFPSMVSHSPMQLTRPPSQVSSFEQRETRTPGFFAQASTWLGSLLEKETQQPQASFVSPTPFASSFRPESSEPSVLSVLKSTARQYPSRPSSSTLTHDQVKATRHHEKREFEDRLAAYGRSLLQV